MSERDKKDGRGARERPEHSDYVKRDYIARVSARKEETIKYAHPLQKAQ